MNIQTPQGNIHVSHQVVSKIAYKVLNEMDGIKAVSSGMKDILNQISNKKQSQGISIDTTNSNSKANLELRIVVNYGVKIHHTCTELQKKVKQSIEDLTGVSVGEIHVKVEEIDIDKSYLKLV
ncbi:Asp23/Gls24 family envelope stress response protein [Neobacillus mesonae]|nr:Asp23/Gls24 family envelope stress response protein [Neobacillus mesonae]